MNNYNKHFKMVYFVITLLHTLCYFFFKEKKNF